MLSPGAGVRKMMSGWSGHIVIMFRCALKKYSIVAVIQALTYESKTFLSDIIAQTTCASGTDGQFWSTPSIWSLGTVGKAAGFAPIAIIFSRSTMRVFGLKKNATVSCNVNMMHWRQRVCSSTDPSWL
jgi:hypothetical protein